LRKKIRAKDRATTAPIPAALITTGAPSREEPQPKLRPATMMSPGRMRCANPGSISSIKCRVSSAGSSDAVLYLEAMM
jgi:hypothetical protein